MKLKVLFCALVLFLISTASLYAQVVVTNPCDGAENDGTCPLDTWVFLLAAFVAVFAFLRLTHLKKQSEGSL